MKRIAVSIAALLALILATAACTQSESSEPSPSASAGPSANTTSDPLAFTQCMRDKGVDMDDPDPDTGRPKPGEGVDPEGEKYQAALQDCQHLLPGSESQDSSDPEDLKKYEAFAKCMRKNGLPDFPDPQPGGQGMFGEVDRSNPNFQKASEACQDLLAGADK